MLITREIDYAVRVVRVLQRGGKLSASEIVEKEGIPMAFAYKILKKLNTAGIVDISRGTKGGYSLADSCEALTLFDIVSALNEDLAITECLVSGYRCSSGELGRCSIHHEFSRIQKILEKELSAKTIAELIK